VKGVASCAQMREVIMVSSGVAFVMECAPCLPPRTPTPIWVHACCPRTHCALP
jgi:hypothetical protein